MLNNLSNSFTCFSLAISLLFSPFSFGTDLNRQQSLFISVEKSLKKGNYQLYQKYRSELNDYPLAPYLEYLSLSGNLKNLSQRDIDRFSNKHPDLPQADQLQHQWLRYLANQKSWRSYLQAYQQDDGGRLQCLKGIALKELGHEERAWQEAKTLWLKGKSQNKACDPLFASWKAAGKLTQSLIIARFWMAAEKNNLSLARYLDKSIKDTSFKVSTVLFWEVHKYPELLNTARFNGELEHQRIIMIHGIKKLVSKDLNLAVSTWLQMRESHPFSLEQRSVVDQKIAMKAAKNFVGNAEEIISSIDPDFHYHKVTEWRIRLALAEQDWERVLILIKHLPGSIRNDSRWRYWNEVALLKFQEESYQMVGMPFPKTPSLLKTPTLRALGRERNFYAFLVADLKGQPFQLNHQQKAIRQQDLQRLKQYYPGFKRIREWIHHERFYSAQAELNRITPSLDNTQKKLIPYLAQQWEWHHQAIMAAARAALWNDLDLRFPTPESDLFSKHAEQRELDYPWVLAIARQESAFHPRARSHSGAMGLMQLMPATAKQAAKQAGIPYRKKSELYKPEINIALGTTHLAWLSKRFENSRILATAAYNAGSTPVKRWLKQRGHLPLDIWIETIPYDETRNYVQSVMAFRVIYSQRESRPARMFSPQEVASLSLNQQETPVIAQRDQRKP